MGIQCAKFNPAPTHMVAYLVMEARTRYVNQVFSREC